MIRPGVSSNCNQDIQGGDVRIGSRISTGRCVERVRKIASKMTPRSYPPIGEITYGNLVSFEHIFKDPSCDNHLGVRVLGEH